MKITWYGHACFELTSQAGTIVIDPYEEGTVPGCRLPYGLAADAVLCSHSHHDHSGTASVALTGRGHSYTVERISSWHDSQGGALRGPNTIHVISDGQVKVVHLGDLGERLSDEKVSLIKDADVLLIPVGGGYTIDGPAAHELAARVNARITVPMHYRGDGFGLGAIGTADAFLALESGVRMAGRNSFDVLSGAERQVLVLRPPVA